MSGFYKLLLLIFIVTLSQDRLLAAEGFEYHAYMRVGAGQSKQQTRGSCYNLRNAGGNAFRFGNECGFYMESTFNYKFPKSEEKDEVWFRSAVNLALIADNLQTMQTSTQNEFTIIDREAYIEAGNVLTEGSILWIGKRFYKRRDIHILDLFLFDSTGTGAGVSEITVGSGKFHLAVMQYRSVGTYTVGTETATAPLLTTTDWRYDWPLAGGNLETIILYGQKSEKPYDAKTSISFEKMSGMEFGLIFSREFEPKIQSKTFLQYGQGLYGASLQYGNLLTGYESDGANFVKSATSGEMKKHRDKSSSSRIAQELIWNGETWDTAFALVYTQESFGGEKITLDMAGNRSAFIAGIRPSLYLNKYWKATLDSGFVRVGNNYKAGDLKQTDTTLTKNSIGLQVSPKSGHYVRPALRFYATHANWSDDAKPYMENLGAAYGNQRSGMTYGVQAEAWW